MRELHENVQELAMHLRGITGCLLDLCTVAKDLAKKVSELEGSLEKLNGLKKEAKQ